MAKTPKKHKSIEVILKFFGCLTQKVLPWQFDCDHSFGLNLNAFPPKFKLGVYRTMKNKIIAISVKCRNRWVMRNLLADYSKFGSLKFVGFTKERVKWFSKPFPVWCKGTYSKPCNILKKIFMINSQAFVCGLKFFQLSHLANFFLTNLHSVHGIRFLTSFSQKICIFHIFDHSL